MMQPIFVMIFSHYTSTYYLLCRFAEVSGFQISSPESEIQPDVILVDADSVNYKDIVDQVSFRHDRGMIPIVLCSWLENMIDQPQVFHLQKPILLKNFQSVIHQAVTR